MTVAELKDELDAYPGDWKVFIDSSGSVATLKVENTKKPGDKNDIIMEEDDEV